MKKLISILLLLAGTAYADWKLNPYTQRQDYYEATGALITSTGTINAALNAEIARATARENAIAVSTGTLGSRMGAAEAALSTAAYTTNSYANPAWITSLASSKLSGTVPTGLVDLSTVSTALAGKLTAPATFYVVKASDYLQAPATSYWVKASDYLQNPATFYVVPASAYLQNPATFYIATSADLSAKVSKSGDTMTGPLTLSGSSLTVRGTGWVDGTLNISSGSAAGGTDTNQILFGFKGTQQYRHAIHTEHNGSGAGGNVFRFYTWAPSQGLNDVGNTLSLTLDNGNAIVAGTATVQGNAFSVGGGTFSVAGGSVKLEAHDDGIGSFLKFRQGNNAAYGFDWADDILTTGNMYLQRVNNEVKTTAIEFIRNSAGVNFPEGSLSVGGSTFVVANGVVNIGSNASFFDSSIHSVFRTNNGGGIQLQPASGSVSLFNNSASYNLGIYNGANPKVWLDANGASYITGGNVGIGNTNPAEKLHVQDGVILSSSTTGFGAIKGYGSSGGCLMFRDTDNAGWTECKFLDGVMTCGIDADGICD